MTRSYHYAAIPPEARKFAPAICINHQYLAQASKEIEGHFARSLSALNKRQIHSCVLRQSEPKQHRTCVPFIAPADMQASPQAKSKN